MLQNKRLTIILMIATILLLIPLVAMQFTTEVNWSAFDFLIAAVVLYGTGIAGDFIWRKVKKKAYRMALCIALLLALALVWIDLAVGIFGTPISGH